MNINVVCPHCLKVNRIPRKDHYTKANCGACKKSLLDSKPVPVDANKLGLDMQELVSSIETSGDS